MELNTLLLIIFGTIIPVAISGVTAYVVLKKAKPEIKNTDADTDKIVAETRKISAETISSYALELKNIKEDSAKERIENEKRYDEMCCEIDSLNKQIREINSNQEKERTMYRTFINELLFGISRLTGQIQATGQPPVWQAPKATPFY